MDIYFCDLCGVRVNDADLRTGQGQRSRWDVICASCLEQGLGKEWLGKRTSARRAAIGAGDAGDRVATIDADPPVRAVAAAAAPEPELAFAPEPPPVAPAPPLSAKKTEVADLPPAPPGLALDDESSHDEAVAPAETPAVADTLEAHDAAHSEDQAEDTARVLKQDSADQFSLAASAFSALGSRKGTDPDSDDDDLVDRAYATPAEQLSPALGVAALTEGQSPFAKGYSPEKDETALVPALPGTDAPVELDEAGTGERKPPGTGTSSRRKSASAKGTSSRITKPPSKNGKSNRSRSKGPDNSRAVLMYSLISLGVILLLFGIAMGAKTMGKGGGTSTGTTVVDDKAISRILSDADAKAVAALRSQDLAEMEAALATLKSAQQSVYKFEDDMRKDGNSDAQIEGVLRRLNASDKFMHIRTLNDAIFKLKQQH